MPDKLCDQHSGHEARLKNLETTVNSAHKRIDGMKNWVIAGMTSLILQLVIVITMLIRKGI